MTQASKVLVRLYAKAISPIAEDDHKTCDIANGDNFADCLVRV